MLNLYNCKTTETNGNWVTILTQDNKSLQVNTKTKTITKNKFMNLLNITKSI